MNNNKPPTWCLWLLRKFANPHTLEELEGDLLEFYRIWTGERGTSYANRKLFFTVITLLRPFATQKNAQPRSAIYTTHVMIESYWKMTWRSLKKDKVSTFINVSGLTLGLAIGVLVLLVVMNEITYDHFQKNRDNLFLLMKNERTNAGISTGRSTAGPMAIAFKSDLPEVKFAARMAGFGDEPLEVDDKVTYESGVYVDPDFFRMMSFAPISGDATGAIRNNSVVLTKDMALKLFGTTDVIGKTLVFNRHHSLVVGAVLENIPPNSSIKFKMAVPFTLYQDANPWLQKWDDNRIETWLQLTPHADVALLNDKMSRILQKKSNDDQTVSLFAYPMKSLHLYNNFSNGHPNGGMITVVWILGSFGVFMLLIACINFMNIATAQSEHRSREVGVRKVLGASRKSIIFQFLNESFVVTFISLGAALALAYSVLPAFNTITHSDLHFNLVTGTEWILIICTGIVTALVAGSYPSLFLSRFVPMRVLKGGPAKSRGGLRRTLVTFQFLISIFFLISTIIMYAQFNFVRNRPLGYEQANLINIPLDSALSAKFELLESEALELPGVVEGTGSSDNILFSGGSVTGMDWPGKRPDDNLSIVIASVGYHWTQTMQIKMVDGRDFDPAYGTDSLGCLLNESAVKAIGLQEPVGSVVGGHRVIGVFQDYVFNNPSGIIAPMAVYLNPRNMNHLYLRVRNDRGWRHTIDQVEKLSKAISPEFPFSFSFTTDEYQQRFDELNDAGLMVSIFGGITLFISCLGLFGLSGFVAEKRSKEMSIRKVFGATVRRVLVALSRDFLKPVFYALALVVPLTVILAKWVLSNFTYHVPIQWWMFALGGIIIFLIALSIVLYHGLRTAWENPVTRLRND